MAQMGLWTSAELSAGLIIGCVPVKPRFFQHASSVWAKYVTLVTFSWLSFKRPSTKNSSNFSLAPVQNSKPDTFSKTYDQYLSYTENHLEIHEEHYFQHESGAQEGNEMTVAELATAHHDVESGEQSL